MFKQIRIVLILTALAPSTPLFAQSASTGAPSPTRSELPPQAQEAMKKGLMAAKLQEWEIAIQSFQEARRAAPAAPELFYNLGLAESKLPGRELRALAWFGAYLAAASNAPNAAAVHDFISELEIKNEGNRSRLLKAVQAAANEVPLRYEKPLIGNGPEYEVQRIRALADVAKLYAYSGDGNKAMEIAINSKIDLNIMCNHGVIYFMISYGGERGIAGARRLLSMGDTYEKEHFGPSIYGAIAEEEAISGDIASAWRDLNYVTKDQGGTTIGNPAEVLIAIAKAQFLAGYREQSWKTLLQAKDVIDKRELRFDTTYYNLAEAQIKSGDSASAQITIGLIKDAKVKNNALGIKGQYTIESASIVVDNWLRRFWDLDEPVFLDSGAYLKGLASDDSQKYFEALEKATYRIIEVQKCLYQMLQEQAKQQGKP